MDDHFEKEALEKEIFVLIVENNILITNSILLMMLMLIIAIKRFMKWSIERIKSAVSGILNCMNFVHTDSTAELSCDSMEAYNK